MRKYILDTSIYGVLVDKHEADYEVIKNIIAYAKKNRENFVTTMIIAKELLSEESGKEIKDIILPEYFLSISQGMASLEIAFSDRFKTAEKLAWNYIQKLEKKDAGKVMYDALNYAWSSVAKIDIFVTRNRRGILARDYWKTLERSNRKMNLPFVKIISPNEFYSYLL